MNKKRLRENGKLPQNDKKLRGEITVYIVSVRSKNVIISCKSIKIQKRNNSVKNTADGHLRRSPLAMCLGKKQDYR
jgi:hypothetical protein